MAAIKRFYQDVALISGESGYLVLLDGRPVLSPNRKQLLLPTSRLAEALAAEWRRQGEFVRSADMPIMRFASHTIDGGLEDPAPIQAEIVKYAGSDLLCYRADHPALLVQRQALNWDPVLERYRHEFGINFVIATGVSFVAQTTESIETFASLVFGLEGFALSGLHSVTALTGSALLAMALRLRWLDAEEVWRLCHLDEDFQAEQWGNDREAVQRRTALQADFSAAVLALSDQC